MASQRLEVAGLHVRHAAPDAAGARPPNLLIHGAGHGAWCWENWMHALPGKGWNCYALSLRGHPGSTPMDEETYCNSLKVSDYADDVRQFAHHIGRPCVVAGHSMGGIVAQQYIAEQTARGEKVAAAVLLASASPGQLGPLRTEPVPTGEPHALVTEAARKRYFFSEDEAVWGPCVAQLAPESPSVMNNYSLGEGVPISPADLPCPVLVVSAEYDGSSAPNDGRIAEYLGADYHFAEGIGHDLMLDAGWEAVLGIVEGWLASKFPAR